MAWDGYLVGAGGHVHGGGINVALRDEATGAECKTNAIYHHGDMHGHAPDEMTLCPVHVQIKEGQEFEPTSRRGRTPGEPDHDNRIVTWLAVISGRCCGE